MSQPQEVISIDLSKEFISHAQNIITDLTCLPKKVLQFINYLTILNHENCLLNFRPICPKPFEDVQCLNLVTSN